MQLPQTHLPKTERPEFIRWNTAQRPSDSTPRIADEVTVIEIRGHLHNLDWNTHTFRHSNLILIDSFVGE